jgi:hypothetical protein
MKYVMKLVGNGKPMGRIHCINDLKFTYNGSGTRAIRIDYDLNLIKRNITHMIYV